MSGSRAERESASTRVKRSIAVVIRRPGAPERWLLVRRPADDEELPGVWGLPAGSLEPGEDAESLIGRIGRDKLGVALVPVAELAAGTVGRARYELSMRLFEARIEAGELHVPQAAPGVTQYAALDWREPRALASGARAGSLCCALGLEVAGGKAG